MSRPPRISDRCVRAIHRSKSWSSSLKDSTSVSGWRSWGDGKCGCRRCSTPPWNAPAPGACGTGQSSNVPAARSAACSPRSTARPQIAALPPGRAGRTPGSGRRIRAAPAAISGANRGSTRRPICTARPAGSSLPPAAGRSLGAGRAACRVRRRRTTRPSGIRSRGRCGPPAGPSTRPSRWLCSSAESDRPTLPAASGGFPGPREPHRPVSTTQIYRPAQTRRGGPVSPLRQPGREEAAVTADS